MNKEKEEYISLRQEIVTLCSSADSIINILYVFLATYLGFAFPKEDTIYVLFSYVVILPLYMLALEKRIAACKIAAYISVFHEVEENKWETRLMKYRGPKEPVTMKYFSAKHFPFIFANCIVLIIFIYKTKWTFHMPFAEIVKVAFEIIMFILVMFIFIKYKKMLVRDYIKEWRDLKEEENDKNKEKYIKFIKEILEEVKEEIFNEIIQRMKEEFKNKEEHV